MEWIIYGKQEGFIMLANNFRILRGKHMIENTVAKLPKLRAK